MSGKTRKIIAATFSKKECWYCHYSSDLQLIAGEKKIFFFVKWLASWLKKFGSRSWLFSRLLSWQKIKLNLHLFIRIWIVVSWFSNLCYYFWWKLFHPANQKNLKMQQHYEYFLRSFKNGLQAKKSCYRKKPVMYDSLLKNVWIKGQTFFLHKYI